MFWARVRKISLPITLLAIALAVFCTGITWGLPSHNIDPYLYGSHPQWSGQKIMELAGGWNPESQTGADVDANPTQTAADTLTLLNRTDAQRAEILRRYRLYSYQPDEWLTLRALSQIKAHHGDPRVYQYGGLWIYPVGALLKIASFTGYIVLHPDPAFYIDHPELFGRFYVVTRLWSVFWGLVGAIVVWLLLRDGGASRGMAWAGGLCFILMPVIVNSAHEAKPHLGGAVLLLCALWAAIRYLKTEQTRWWWCSAIFAGSAAAMVIFSFLGWIILPTMMLFSRRTWKRRLAGAAGACVVAGTVYLLFNPFVPINAILAPEVLRSNLGNSTAMYGVSNLIAGAWNTIRLLGEGTSRILAAIGLVGAAVLILSRTTAISKSRPVNRDTLWLMLIPALGVALVMAALGAGKPAEYGRFGIFTDCILLLMAFLACDRLLKGRVERIGGPLVLILSTTFFGLIYLRGFYRDASPHSSRMTQAALLQTLWSQGSRTLALPRDPAPYNLPPVNLFDWRLYLLPESTRLRTDEMLPDMIVRPVDRPTHSGGGDFLIYEPVPDPAPHGPIASPISWADKPMEFLHRRPSNTPLPTLADTLCCTSCKVSPSPLYCSFLPASAFPSW